jgi:hypothetical protein
MFIMQVAGYTYSKSRPDHPAVLVWSVRKTAGRLKADYSTVVEVAAVDGGNLVVGHAVSG